jgi:hypothetical protein
VQSQEQRSQISQASLTNIVQTEGCKPHRWGTYARLPIPGKRTLLLLRLFFWLNLGDSEVK